MTALLPPLVCPACGTVGAPRVEPGSGPHWGKAVCQCGRFLKWVARPKEVCMQASINRCILLGSIDRRGVEVSYHGQGTARASFMLVLSELVELLQPTTRVVWPEILGTKALSRFPTRCQRSKRHLLIGLKAWTGFGVSLSAFNILRSRLPAPTPYVKFQRAVYDVFIDDRY
jgi:hypothetical protein